MKKQTKILDQSFDSELCQTRQKRTAKYIRCETLKTGKGINPYRSYHV